MIGRSKIAGLVLGLLSAGLACGALAQTEPATSAASTAPATPSQSASDQNRSNATSALAPSIPPSSTPAAPPAGADTLQTAPQDKPATPADDLQTVNIIRTSLIFTLLALLPVIAVCMTPFVRIVVVLSMIRHAFGMPETPPSQVLVALSLFLTTFLMLPTLEKVNAEALQPLLAGSISVQQALESGSGPMRIFMLKQVHDVDIKTVYDIAKRPLPTSATKVGIMELTTAFMLNELRVSFKIGFVILLPFLLIDLVVSSILLGLGMMMVPPSTLSLPIKVLMFVLIDGWSLVLQGVVGSFR